MRNDVLRRLFVNISTFDIRQSHAVRDLLLAFFSMYLYNMLALGHITGVLQF